MTQTLKVLIDFCQKLQTCLTVCRTEHNQDARPDLSCVTAVSEDVAASSANKSLDVAEETAARRQNGGADAKAEVKEEEQEEVVHEEKEEEEEKEERKEMVAEVKEEEEEVQEAPSGDGSDANSREASGKEEQPAGESHGGEVGDEEQVLAQGGPGSRLVARHLFLFCFGWISEFTHITHTHPSAGRHC